MYAAPMATCMTMRLDVMGAQEHADPVTTCMTRQKAIPTTALPLALPLKTFPRTGPVLSAGNIKMNFKKKSNTPNVGVNHSPGDPNSINNYLGIGKGIQIFLCAKPGKISQRQTKDGAGNFVKGQKGLIPLSGQTGVGEKKGGKYQYQGKYSPGQDNPLDLNEQFPGSPE